MVEINNRVALSFDDVSLLDDYSELESRSEVDISQRFGPFILGMPVALASMASLNSVEMAEKFMAAGGMYIHHRYCSVEERLDFARQIFKLSSDNTSIFSSLPVFGVSVGLSETEAEIVDLCASFDLISIDVASANNRLVIERVREIVELLESEAVQGYVPTPLLMVGNFSNPEFVHRLYKEGLFEKVDFLKVSQGGGSVCSTRTNIGVGVPTFQAVLDVKTQIAFTKDAAMGTHGPAPKTPKIVADGGVRTTGDIVKALGAGAHVVMCGGMFAGFNECPGLTHRDQNGKVGKEFNGMASSTEKKRGDKDLKHIEGVSSLVPLKGPITPFLDKVKENIRSGVATAGHSSVQSFVGNGRFVRITANGTREGTAHVNGIVRED